MGGWYVTGLLKTVFSKCSSLLPKNCRDCYWLKKRHFLESGSGIEAVLPALTQCLYIYIL